MPKISSSLEDNIALMRRLFANDKTMVVRPCEPQRQRAGQKLRFCVFFCDGMVDTSLINDNIIRPLTLLDVTGPVGDAADYLATCVLQSGELKQSDNIEDITHAMVYGDTIVCCDGAERALIVNSKGFVTRSVSEPTSELVLRGPREGFTEALLPNLSMIRRKIRTNALKFEYITLGAVTKTTCCLCFVEGVASARVLDAVRRRLARIDIDGVFGANYLTELIRDARRSPFHTVGTTERPDVVAAKLLEGRVALLVDGTPVALTVPHIFIEHFQSSEDYNVSFQFAAISRVLRILGFLIAVSIVPMYMAVILYHAEMLPTIFLFSVSAAREGVPIPTIVEALALLFAFDVLREAGARTPTNVGSALSIVGALVLGQAAVEARFVSAPMVIVVALSGITGIMLPKLNGAIILCRIGLVVLAAAFGMYGYVFGMVWLLMHLISLESFGVPVFSHTIFDGKGQTEDSVWRPPFSRMKRAGRFIAGRPEGGGAS